MQDLSQQPELNSIEAPQFPDIIDMIKRTCTRLMMEKIHKINDFV